MEEYTFPQSEVIAASSFWRLADALIVDPSAFGIREIAKPEFYPNVCPVQVGNGTVSITSEHYKRIISAQVLYVCANMLPIFFSLILPNLKRPIVIITGTTDENITKEIGLLAENPIIAHWFAQNVDTRHRKITPIPIGIANENWPHGSKDAITQVMSDTVGKQELCYMNYKLTNQGIRLELARKFIGQPFIKLEGQKPYLEYLRALKSCDYCLSPPGAGIDCHRTWESLYMGTIPLVSAGPWMSSFDDLPIVAVADWSPLEWKDILRMGGPFGRFNPMIIPKLKFSWWADHIRQTVSVVLGGSWTEQQVTS